MTKPTNDKDYKITVRRIIVSFQIVIPYILLFFFLERYGIIDNFTEDKKAVASAQALMKENEELKAENLRLTQELERLQTTSEESTDP